ncbi:MAG: ubiquinone anaerobic biosynthesis protein UbiV [Betaproteobacteria bacterium]
MNAASAKRLRLTLGPLLYYWPRERVFEFYEQVAGWPVDTVHVGEAVCNKRHELRPQDYLEIAANLAAKGKEVVLSTCELAESEQDLRVMRKIAGNGRLLVEANDLGAVKLLAGKGPFVCGPYLNIYSRPTLEVFRSFGATRWVMPIEMSREGLREVLREPGLDMETEVFSYGRLPLAISARCFTARYNNLTKDDCQFKCRDHPDGLLVSTQDEEAFLAVNGLQTQSARVHELASELPGMAAMGVDRVRLSPQSQHMGEVIDTFRRVADGSLAPAEASRILGRIAPGPLCDGYWHGRPGHERSAHAQKQAVGA